MKKFKMIVPAIILSAVMGMAGCGEVKFEPTENSIFAKKDGTVISADIEEFDSESYSVEDLTAFVEEAVSAYNKEHDAEEKAYAENKEVLPVAINEIKVSEDKKASLLLKYATTEDYVEFTGTAGMEEGIASLETKLLEELPDAKYLKADGTEIETDAISVTQNTMIVSIEGPVKMVVEGTIQFVSDGVTIVDKNTVTTPSGEVSYVIFK